MGKYEMFRVMGGVFILAGVLLTSTVALATIILPVTLESMTEAADTIVVATVKSQHSYWEDKNIYTDVVIEVQEVIKNAEATTSPEITLKLVGGTVGDIRQEVDGSASFQRDDKAVLFLNTFNDKYTTFALEYGVYKIHRDPASQQDVLNGPFFDYQEHLDLKTKQWVKTPKESFKDDAKEVRTFINRIKTFVK